ncbi:hypothetical protein K239x_38600 [Planctomycetes bacterium K23_9]|uniref:Uncharacterized protein n=1 Tax=Stieleria marina TaxID=1930275 RepID=A0A517NXL1_9BACT|nr:hypothetical protein K239x_38600 [Planctomycetes bacterium K23_9]
MGAETRVRRFSEATVKQVTLDCERAMERARFCPRRSRVLQIRCVDDRQETETSFGNQLWYFEGRGIDATDSAHTLFGVVEYSLQYGLSELVEDGVYDSETQREKFRSLYEREIVSPTWENPAHRWLAAGVIAVTTVFTIFLLLTKLTK